MSSVLTVKELVQGEELFQTIPEWVRFSQGGRRNSQKTCNVDPKFPMKHDLFPLPSYLCDPIKELPRNFSLQNKAYYTLFSTRIYFIRISSLKFGKILRINPRLRFWKGYNFLCLKTVNTIQLYVFNLFHSVSGKTCQQDQKTCTNYNWYPNTF